MGRLNPFKCSEMLGNYKGKMLDEVSRLEDDIQPLEDDLQTTEDDLQTKEDDLDITEMTICYFLSINKDQDWLNLFKCSETIGNYEGS